MSIYKSLMTLILFSNIHSSSDVQYSARSKILICRNKDIAMYLHLYLKSKGIVILHPEEILEEDLRQNAMLGSAIADGISFIASKIGSSVVAEPGHDIKERLRHAFPDLYEMEKISINDVRDLASRAIPAPSDMPSDNRTPTHQGSMSLIYWHLQDKQRQWQEDRHIKLMHIKDTMHKRLDENGVFKTHLINIKRAFNGQQWDIVDKREFQDYPEVWRNYNYLMPKQEQVDFQPYGFQTDYQKAQSAIRSGLYDYNVAPAWPKVQSGGEQHGIYHHNIYSRDTSHEVITDPSNWSDRPTVPEGYEFLQYGAAGMVQPKGNEPAKPPVNLPKKIGFDQDPPQKPIEPENNGFWKRMRNTDPQKIRNIIGNACMVKVGDDALNSIENSVGTPVLKIFKNGGKIGVEMEFAISGRLGIYMDILKRRPTFNHAISMRFGTNIIGQTSEGDKVKFSSPTTDILNRTLSSKDYDLTNIGSENRASNSPINKSARIPLTIAATIVQRHVFGENDPAPVYLSTPPSLPIQLPNGGNIGITNQYSSIPSYLAVFFPKKY
jgi:hypothetical protein